MFSGIGAQKQGIEDSGVWNCEVIATSDIDKDSIISYSAMHNNLTDEMVANYSDYPSEEVMRNELLSKNIGYNLKTKTNPVSKMKGDKLRKHWLAMKLSNNLGDISKIEGLPYADFWTYSFCCQDISVAGKQAGNSIVTNCIKLIMQHLYKAQVDSDYECYDENFIKLSQLKNEMTA